MRIGKVHKERLACLLSYKSYHFCFFSLYECVFLNLYDSYYIDLFRTKLLNYFFEPTIFADTVAVTVVVNAIDAASLIYFPIVLYSTLMLSLQ